MSTSYIYEVFEHLLRLLMGIWLHTHTITTTDASPDLWELAEIVPDASVQTMPQCFGWGCRTFQTASHVHIIHIYERFEHIIMLWVGIWRHIPIVTYTDTSPDLWELAYICPYASVETMPLQDCRTFQTASHVNIIPIWGVWAPSEVMDGYMASQSHHYHRRRFPRFSRVGWNPTWCKCANHATKLWLRQ
jgi:hypothetical protein